MNFWEKLTLESDPDLQQREFVRKYCETFIWLRIKDKKPILVYFKEYDRDAKLYYFIDENKNDIRVAHDTEHAILEASFPSPKFITYDSSLVWFGRIPARQYRKGICRDNVAYIDVLTSAMRTMTSPIGVGFEIIEETFYPTYLDLDVACSSLYDSNECTGFAVNANWGVTLDPSSDETLLLWNLGKHVAKIRDKSITPLSFVYDQEVRDFINRSRLDYKVL